MEWMFHDFPVRALKGFFLFLYVLKLRAAPKGQLRSARGPSKRGAGGDDRFRALRLLAALGAGHRRLHAHGGGERERERERATGSSHFGSSVWLK